MRKALLVVFLIVGVVAPPPQRVAVEQAAKEEQAARAKQDEEAQAAFNQPLRFSYQKYLEEVVQILESDPKFSEKMREMNEADIKTGKIADHIDDLDNGIFDKLHKAKLQEIERLREQIEAQIKVDGGHHNVKMPEHLDVNNWEKFGREDLRKLIVTTVQDMDEFDKQRQAEFKEYEMKKQANEDHKLAQMNEQERGNARHEAEEAKKRHNEHEKLKHPGSRDQLEEVWEDTDHMDKDSFDPKTFFGLHDLNGDGFWNSEELEALFQLELEKMYNETNPDDDPRERLEEMSRMREHVTKQMDKNNDRMISLQEFLQDTEAQTPDKDPGWKDLGDTQVYTDEELREFEKAYAASQGWGDHAYDPVTPAGPAQQPIQPQAPNEVHAQQPQQAHIDQPQAAQHPQAAAAQAQSAPVHHAPIVDVPKDPVYGI